ncbi:MAG: molecular chaperone DnaJ [Rickettsiales bacterium]|jgi:molecular chaperone DnaJ|nr:molecular chaperone DnaJ [Rickettsiales bacterium]
MNKNPYEILGVAKNASDADIKRAYHKLVMKYHPDKNQGDKGAEEKFKEINNAFDVLKDPQKRAAYDQFGDAAFGGGSASSAGFGSGNPFGNMGGGAFHFDMGGGMDDILKEAMKSFGFGGGGGFGFDDDVATAGGAGRDMLHEITISLKEAYLGKVETIKYTTNVKCDKCNGNGTDDGKPAPVCPTCDGSGRVRTRRGLFMTESVCPECSGLGRIIKKKCSKCDGTGIVQERRELKVEIPAGIENGTRMRFSGMGEAGMLGGAAGDFFVDIHIRSDNRFARRGRDLYAAADVPFTTLALGGEIEFDTIDDKKLDVKIPSGTQVGERLRVRGRGFPGGDLFIQVSTSVPTKLTEKQKKALAEFSDGAPKKKKGWL